MKIVVVGLGYVGLSNASILAQNNDVVGVDTSQERVDLINIRKSPIVDYELEHFLATENLKLVATTEHESAYINAEFIVVATPTDYDTKANYFETTSVESVINSALKINPNAHHCHKIYCTGRIYFANGGEEYSSNSIFFCPEFLREGHALRDNMYPSRIIIGDNSKRSLMNLVNLLIEGALQEDVNVLFTGAKRG